MARKQGSHADITGAAPARGGAAAVSRGMAFAAVSICARFAAERGGAGGRALSLHARQAGAACSRVDARAFSRICWRDWQLARGATRWRNWKASWRHHIRYHPRPGRTWSSSPNMELRNPRAHANFRGDRGVAAGLRDAARDDPEAGAGCGVCSPMWADTKLRDHGADRDADRGDGPVTAKAGGWTAHPPSKRSTGTVGAQGGLAAAAP